MCYDIKASLESQLKRAIRKGDLQAIEEIRERLVPLTDLPLFHASGFTHPELLIYTGESPVFPEVATWGLIPHWVSNQEQKNKIWNNTLNARGETIFDKPSFREAAKSNHCIIYVDGFYEHHHFGGKTYPFYIARKNMQPLALAGLYNVWKNPNQGGTFNTFSIVTTKGNYLLSKIHNNPKLKEPRMPLILNETSEDLWLESYSKESIKKLIKSFPSEELIYHTVRSLRGKDYIGNVEGVSKAFIYEELNFN
jgi:putative SOS response-associated peptidase YedK